MDIRAAAAPQAPTDAAPSWAVVGVAGRSYLCADIDAVDHHLRVLRVRLRNAQEWAYYSPACRTLVDVFREDIDRLLDLRWSLRDGRAGNGPS